MRLRLIIVLFITALFGAWIASHANIRLQSDRIGFHFPHYGYYRIDASAANVATVAFVILGAAAAIVAPAGRLMCAMLKRFRRQVPGLILILSLALSLGLHSIPFSLPWIVHFLLLALCIGVFAAPAGKRKIVARGIVALGRRFSRMSDKSIAVVLIVVSLPTTLAIGLLLYEDTPMTGDAASALFQAALMARGQITMKVEFPDFYNGTALILKHGVASMYPPGHPLTLTPAEFLRIPWLTGPLLGALTVALVFLIGARWFGRVTGLIAACLLAFTPHFLAMTPSYMSHSTTMFFLALTMYTGLVLAGPQSGWRVGALTGFAAGMAFLSRPMTALAIGAPIGIMFLVRMLKFRRWMAPASAAVVLTLMAVMFLFYNYKTTGNPFLTGYEAYGPMHKMGFGGVTDHTPEKGLFNGLNNLWEFSRWAPGAFPTCYFWLLLWLVLGPFSWRELTLAAMWLLLPIVYFFYFGQDYSLGPRFVYELCLPGSLLAGRAIQSLSATITAGMASNAARSRKKVLVALGAAVFIGTIPISIVQVLSVHGLRLNTSYMYWRRNFTNDPNVVVFVDDYRHSVALAETARHPEGPLFLQHQSEMRNREFMRRYPEKIYYYYDGSGVAQLGDSPNLPVTPSHHYQTSLRRGWPRD